MIGMIGGYEERLSLSRNHWVIVSLVDHLPVNQKLYIRNGHHGIGFVHVTGAAGCRVPGQPRVAFETFGRDAISLRLVVADGSFQGVFGGPRGGD